MAGEIIHLEIPSRSFERSASFYAKLFGWRTDGQQAGGHLHFEIPRGPATSAASTTGSLIRSALAQSTGPLPFIAVDDVDETLAEAERQGGRVLARRLPLAGHGQYALLADVDGNVIAVVAGAASEKGAPADKGAAVEKKKAKDDTAKSPRPAKNAASEGERPSAPAAPAGAKPGAKAATRSTAKTSLARKR